MMLEQLPLYEFYWYKSVSLCTIDYLIGLLSFDLTDTVQWLNQWNSYWYRKTLEPKS